MKKFLLIFCFPLKILFAQPESSGTVNKSFSLGLRTHYSYIFIHAKDMIPNSDYFPRGVELNFNWHLIGQKTWEQCNCYPRTGFIISFFDFDNPKILGSGYTAAYYIEPFFSSHKKINFSVRGGAGISYLTKPFHPVHNPENMAYSMKINGYVLLNFGANYRVNKFWNLNSSFNINHISNGGFKDPNKGINFPSLSLSVDYTFHPVEFRKIERTVFDNKNTKKLRKEIALFSANRAISHGEKKRYFVYGISVNVSRQVSKLSALSAGTEWMIDYALKEKLERNGYAGRDFKRGGILLGHEFLMGRFVFSQQFGIYVYNPARFSDFYFKYNDPVYQRYGLSYKIGNHLTAGIHLKVDRYIANFIDMRVGVVF